MKGMDGMVNLIGKKTWQIVFFVAISVFLFSTNLVEEFVFAQDFNFLGTVQVVPPFPVIISLTASDPDGLDAVYGDDDIITVTFDKPTKVPK